MKVTSPLFSGLPAKGTLPGMKPLMAQPMPGAPKGKRHAKITHVSSAHKKG